MRRWCGAVGLALLVPVTALQAQERAAGAVEHRDSVQQPEVTANSHRAIDFLTGGAATASRAGTGQADPPVPEPPWLYTFREKLRTLAQPAMADRLFAQHPLARAPLQLLRVSDAATTVPVVAAAGQWPEVLCPVVAGTRPSGSVAVRVQALLQSDNGDHTLGIDIACISANWQVIVASRLVAECTGRGEVRSVTGVRIARSLPISGGAPADVTRELSVQWQVTPAPVQSQRPAWILPNGQGWLAQVALNTQSDWSDDQVLLRPEPYREPSDKLPPRGLWWFDRTGKPLAVLLQRGQTAAGELRAPLHREAVADVVLRDQDGQFVLQRVAATSAAGQPLRAGYVAWQLHNAAAVPWQLQLPALAVEGLWQCQLATEERTLACHFQAAAMQVQVQVLDLALVPDRATHIFAPPPVRR